MTMMEIIKRQPCCGEDVFGMLLLTMETAIKTHENTGRCVAKIAMDSYHYGVMQGKRMERARRKRSKQ